MSLSKRNAPYAVWREVVKAAEAFLAERPWEVITEETIFGVWDPESGQILYCTILGLLGEVFGLAAYPGPQGLRAHLRMRNSDYRGVEPHFYLYSHLISFENKPELSKKDHRLLKDLRRSYRGGRWPQFRTYRPGYMEDLPGEGACRARGRGPVRGSLLPGLAPRIRDLDQPQQGGPDDRRPEEVLRFPAGPRISGL
ncbi:MAG: hypothetical protein V5A74_03455 [Desulfohalobiaceae bacterium]